MKLGKWLEEIFTKKSPENSEIIAGFIHKFEFKGKEVEITRMDSIISPNNDKRNITFRIYVDWKVAGDICYKDEQYQLKNISYSKKDEEINIQFLEKAKEVLERKFEFVDSPKYNTLAIRRKVEKTIENYLFEFQIDGKKYFIEKIPVSSDKTIDRIYYVTNEAGKVKAKIKFQDLKIQPYDSRENNDNSEILKKALDFLLKKQRDLEFPDLILESGAKQ